MILLSWLRATELPAECSELLLREGSWRKAAGRDPGNDDYQQEQWPHLAGVGASADLDCQSNFRTSSSSAGNIPTSVENSWSYTSH